MNDANSVIVEAWNTVLYKKFCRFRHLLVDGLAQHSDAAFERCRYREGTRVLDVGCGFGDSTLRIAKLVGRTGEAVGVDCAENFIRDSQADARKQGVANANFFVGDAQWGDLRGPTAASGRLRAPGSSARPIRAEAGIDTR
jgi:ubiquinone/menaquinone biosynthesis C-methylase UbiE